MCFYLGLPRCVHGHKRANSNVHLVHMASDACAYTRMPVCVRASTGGVCWPAVVKWLACSSSKDCSAALPNAQQGTVWLSASLIIFVSHNSCLIAFSPLISWIAKALQCFDSRTRFPLITFFNIPKLHALCTKDSFLIKLSFSVLFVFDECRSEFQRSSQNTSQPKIFQPSTCGQKHTQNQ